MAVSPDGFVLLLYSARTEIAIRSPQRAVFVRISVIRTKAVRTEELLNEFRELVLTIVEKVLIPILPFFIAANFSLPAYEGALASGVPVFLAILVITPLVLHLPKGG